MAKKRGVKTPDYETLDGMFAAISVPATNAVPSTVPPVSALIPPALTASASSDDGPFRLTPDQRAALDLTRNRVISASAGTGKTHTLTALYLGLLEGRLTPGGALLSQDEWLAKAQANQLTPMHPNEIVAVTFTEKAAAELLERTRAALEKELTRELPAALKEHLTQCRKALFSAPVSTIHSFCGRLLREAGADGPVPAAFTVLEQEEATELFEESLAAAAAEMLDSGDSPYLQKLAQECGVFTHRSGLLDAGRSLIDALRTRGLRADALRPRPTATLAQIQEWIGEFYAGIDAVPAKGRSVPKPELRAVCAEKKIPATLEEARLLSLTILPLLTGVWVERSELSLHFSEILQACHAPFAEALSAFVERAQLNYAAAKRKAGGVDFDDLMLASKALLDAEKRSEGAIQRGYRFVLIDEYQDTNPLQREILFGVAFPTGSRAGVARLGVVGDVKQSIYKFRGADVTLMEEAVKEFGPAPLRENFRSRKTVIECLNGLFASVWPSGGRFVYDAAHHLAHAGDAARHAWEGPAGEVITWEKDETGNAERHRQNQAFAIARRIRTLVAPAEKTELPRPVIWPRGGDAPRKNVRYGDIAILLSSIKKIREPLQIALASLCIPFRILRGTSFFTRQEIIDVTNLWAVACDASESFAVAGLLRSPFVGMSDAGLWTLAGVSPDTARPEAFATLAERILAADAAPPKGLSADDTQALQRATKLLAYVTASRGRKTAVEILDWALTETGFLSVQALQPRGEEAVAAVRKAIELARAFETRGNRHLSDFVRWMRDHADAEWDDAGAAGQDFSGDLPNDDDAVQIGTIHSAKGLEFPIVFFADAGAGSPPKNGWALYSPENGLGLRLGSEFDGLRGAADAVHLANAEKTRQEESAERQRLLYVALTRARDYLVILGEVSKIPGDANWRKMIDAFRTNNPHALPSIPSKHVELRAATPGEASGLLEFKDGAATVRADAKVDAAALPKPAAAIPPLASDVRVSVSRLALWLWCPRRAAFAAFETDGGAKNVLSQSSDSATLDAEDAASGALVEKQEAETDTAPDARALGTAVHAALETFFGADDPLSPDTEALAADRFTRELKDAPASPEMKAAYDRVLALARSEWGRRILVLPAEDRQVETPFRWKIGVPASANGGGSVTLIGQLDLLAKTGAAHWDVVDYKLASLKDKTTESESVTRYAWQAGLYARVAAEVLKTPAENVDAALAFLKDDSPEPKSIAALGHGRISNSTLARVAAQFAEVARVTNPLDRPAQVWSPAECSPVARSAELCTTHRCPYVGQCFQ